MSGAAPVTLAGQTLLLDPCGVVFAPDHRTMIVSDLHLEKASALAVRRKGFLPPYDTSVTLHRLAAAVRKWRPARVVSLGDSFHDDGGAGRMAGPDRDALLAIMAGRDWVWIAGNHDPAPPADLPGHCTETLRLGSLLLRHDPLETAEPGEISGHLHPGARVKVRGGLVRGPCFASDGQRLVMPAFGTFTGCLNVLDEAFASLFDWTSFCAYMAGRRRTFCIRRTHLETD